MPRKPSNRASVVSLPQPHRSPPSRSVIGRLLGAAHEGGALVTIDGEVRPRTARASVVLRPRDVGAVVTLLVHGDEIIITGVVRTLEEVARDIRGPARELRLDGEALLLEAERELILRCGKASVTLRRDGKVVVKGTHVLQASSGLHRIKGASVEIN